MTTRNVWLLAIALCFGGSAWAQQSAPAEPPAAMPVPATPAPQPQAATPAPPPADSTLSKSEAVRPAEPATSAPAVSSPLEAELDADKIMAAQRAGYQIKNENGQTLLCRRDRQTGSHTRYRTSCLTAREWEQLRSDNEQQLKAIERRPRMSNQ
ncbi:MAG: hypothetical protein SXG53_02560 [Pseudomonadota bacterium]|nr:hypothetical protein [Pseudomonadota bacterium]